MPSWQTRLTTRLIRWRVKPRLGDMKDIARVREAFGQALRPPRGATYTAGHVGGVPGEWVQAVAGQRSDRSDAHAGPAGEPQPTLLYLHGGGFIGCSPRTHRPLTAAFAVLGFKVFVPDYRLAPEHPYPAALDDVRAVWRALCEAQCGGTSQHAEPGQQGQQGQKARQGRLVVAGDSAGGNLALALMLTLRDELAGGEQSAATSSGRTASKPARLPDAAALFSPATDLSGGSASVLDNAERDAMFAGAALGNLADAYLNGADPTQPLVSPLLGDLTGLPPLLLHVGEDECLRDDSLRLAQKARAAGVRVQLQVWAGVPHVWQLLPWLPEARQSVRLAADFLRGAKPLLESQPEPLDVLIVGAGLSGIGQAAHLQQHCADQRYAILESRPAMGGTWDLFRYPGIRSDSDMYTLGYAFKPWTDAKAIADGPSILKYIQETARERGIDAQIRYGHRVVSASWSSDDARWHVAVDVQAPALPGQPETAAPQRRYFSTRFLLLCCGYYRYDQGHRPTWPGQADYTGQWVHPQAWPQNLSWQGRHVVVVGSGATAVTLLPELAKGAASVTMLQRSPTYMINLPLADPLAGLLKPWAPRMLAYRLVRLKNISLGMLFFKLSRARPQLAAKRLLGLAREQLGPGVDMANFTPRYKPWDQRICVLPDGDLFETVKAGRASIVTDEIERFTPQGMRLKSGRELPADIVVSATGLELNVLGDIQMQVDGVPVQPAETLAYKGMMFSGVPNLVYTFGYTNASWTLKADLTAQYTCRLINLMNRDGLHIATPQRDAQVQVAPFLDFTSGYVQRALAKLPKQGDRKPWRLYQNYLRDWLLLRLGRVREKHLRLQAVPNKAD